MLNSINIAGRITAAPDIKYTQSDKAVVSFSIACEDDFKSQDGVKKTHFVRCAAFGQSAKFMDSYVHKGDLLAVNGRLTIQNWTDKDGNKRETAEIAAQSVYLLSSVSRDAETKKPVERDSEPNTAYKFNYDNSQGFADVGDTDGELPFD